MFYKNQKNSYFLQKTYFADLQSPKTQDIL